VLSRNVGHPELINVALCPSRTDMSWICSEFPLMYVIDLWWCLISLLQYGATSVLGWLLASGLERNGRGLIWDAIPAYSWRQVWFGGFNISVGIGTRYGPVVPKLEPRWDAIPRTSPHLPQGPPSLLYNGYRLSFPGVKRPGRGAVHPLHSTAGVQNASLLPSVPAWHVTGQFYLYLYL
jgi:hypothetical protein